MPQLTFRRERHAQGGPRWAKRTRSPNPRAPPHARPRAPRLGLGAVRRLRRAKAASLCFGGGRGGGRLARRSSRALGHAARPCHPFVRERRRARACGALRERTLAVREHRPLDTQNAFGAARCLAAPHQPRQGGARRGCAAGWWTSWPSAARVGARRAGGQTQPKGGRLQLWVWVWVSLISLVSGVGNACRG